MEGVPNLSFFEISHRKAYTFNLLVYSSLLQTVSTNIIYTTFTKK